MPSESHKRNNKKWDAENMVTLGTRIKKSDAELFKAMCAANGTTAHAVLREAVIAYMDSNRDAMSAEPARAAENGTTGAEP